MRIALFSDCFYSTLLDADRWHRPGTETIAFGDCFVFDKGRSCGRTQ